MVQPIINVMCTKYSAFGYDYQVSAAMSHINYKKCWSVAHKRQILKVYGQLTFYTSEPKYTLIQ